MASRKKVCTGPEIFLCTFKLMAAKISIIYSWLRQQTRGDGSIVRGALLQYFGRKSGFGRSYLNKFHHCQANQWTAQCHTHH